MTNIEFTKKEMESFPIKEMSRSSLAVLIGRINIIKDPLKLVEGYKDGQYIGIHQDEDGQKKRIFLKKITIQKFNMKYSNMQNRRKGKELLITSAGLNPPDIKHFMKTKKFIPYNK